MNGFVTILAALAGAGIAFWAVLALVDWLQKGKKKNSPPLEGDDQSQNADQDGAPD